MLRVLVVMATLAAISAQTPAAVASHTLGQDFARVTTAILAFAQWPVPRPHPRLCLVGPDALGDGAGQRGLPGDWPVTILDAQRKEGLDECDALYLGALDMPSMRAWTRQAFGLPVVTIAEDDPDCASNAMFCLLSRPDRVSFRINIDAVARSRARIDPRVLRVSAQGP